MKKILKFTGAVSHINIGTGKLFSKRDTKIIKEISGFKGKIVNNKIFLMVLKKKY